MEETNETADFDTKTASRKLVAVAITAGAVGCTLGALVGFTIGDGKKPYEGMEEIDEARARFQDAADDYAIEATEEFKQPYECEAQNPQYEPMGKRWYGEIVCRPEGTSATMGDGVETFEVLWYPGTHTFEVQRMF